MIEKFRLIDFFWEYKETVMDTDFRIGKNSMVIGNFLYLETNLGLIRKFRCAIPHDIADGIEREMRQAMYCARKFSKEVSQ